MKKRIYPIALLFSLTIITGFILAQANILPKRQAARPSAPHASEQKPVSKVIGTKASNSSVNTVNNQPPEAFRIYQKGLQAFSSKDYHLAITLENQAIQKDKMLYQAYNVKGIAECFSGDYTSGITDINQSLKLQPNYGYGIFNKALSLELYGHYDEAIHTYKSALQLHTNDWWVAWCYYGIASIYGRRGDVQDTVSYLQQAIRINPAIKKDARTEKDFDNVRTSQAFQSAIQ